MTCLCDDAHVGERDVQRSDALLLRDEAGDGAIDLAATENSMVSRDVGSA